MSKYRPLWEYLKGCGEETPTLSFERIAEILGFPIDHSFLNYKKESAEYGYAVGKISLKNKNGRLFPPLKERSAAERLSRGAARNRIKMYPARKFSARGLCCREVQNEFFTQLPP